MALYALSEMHGICIYICSRCMHMPCNNNGLHCKFDSARMCHMNALRTAFYAGSEISMSPRKVTPLTYATIHAPATPCIALIQCTLLITYAITWDYNKIYKCHSSSLSLLPYSCRVYFTGSWLYHLSDHCHHCGHCSHLSSCVLW